MRRHLARKTKCPACKDQIELTEDIKQCILENRIYVKPEVQKPPSITQIINNYNTINNVVAKMDPLEKLMNILQHHNIEVIDFKSSVEQSMQPKLIELKESFNSNTEFTKVDQKDIMSIIDTLTSFKSIQSMNVVYENVPDKLKIFSGGEWKPYMFDAGVDVIISTLQTTYLDHYELYLITKYHISRDIYERQCIKEFIQEYYKFIACFELNPKVQNVTDGEILQTKQRSYDLSEQFYPLFMRIRDDLKHTAATSLRRNVVKLIRTNHQASVLEINKKIMELIQMDEDFKNDILQKMSLYAS